MKRISLVLVTIIISAISFSQGCLPEGIFFGSQSEIDNFQINYPNCTEIEGNVSIYCVDNLYGLSVLSYVGGELRIENTSLTDFSGLNNLDSINGSVMILNNPELTHLTGLEALKKVNGNIDIWGNEVLQDLSGLDSLASAHGIYFTENAALINLSGMESLTSCGQLLIESNNSLYNLSGLENITSLYDLWIANNAIISNLSGLENLTEIQHSIFIMNNNLLETLMPLDGISNIPGQISIDNNPNLLDLSGLQNLTNIGFSLYLKRNHSLTNLTGLENLTAIGSDFSIIDNASLISLDGLESLTNVSGSLEIGNPYTGPNSSLINISGIENINENSIDNLLIRNNPSLSTCNVESICSYLASPNGTVYISGNAEGCNSQDEVFEECFIGTNEIVVSEEQINIYPNPAKNKINISCFPIIKVITIDLHSITNQKILSIKAPFDTIDISNLKPGLYFVEINTSDGNVRKKLIVK